MNNSLRYILFLLLLFGGSYAHSQQYLYLVKKGDTPYKRLTIGDNLKLKTSETDGWVNGRISAISAKSITLGRVTYPYAEIEAMRTYNSLMKTGGYALGIGGVMFTGIAFFNRSVNGDTPLLYPGQIITGAILVTSGYIMYLCSRKTYRKSNGWQFKVIDLEE